jgi:hypothetical protein
MKIYRLMVAAAFLMGIDAAANAAQQCLPCAAGKWPSVTGTGKCDADCPAGNYCTGGSKVQCTGPQCCPAGSSAPKEVVVGNYCVNNTEIKSCEKGYKCPNGVKVACSSDNEYQDQIIQVTCKDCSSPNAVTTDRTRCCKADGNTCRTGNLSGWGGIIESGCFNSSNAQAYNAPTGGAYCHCRGRTASGALSSWGFYSYYDVNFGFNCAAYCAHWCANSVGTWGPRAAW